MTGTRATAAHKDLVKLMCCSAHGSLVEIICQELSLSRRRLCTSATVLVGWMMPLPLPVRRMCDSAAHLVDHVLPDVAVRQGVLTAALEVRLVRAPPVRADRAELSLRGGDAR